MDNDIETIRSRGSDYWAAYVGWEIKSKQMHLTATNFESGPMPTPWKILAGPPLLPSCKLG